jgi:pimeloyl-ACP methyl ester carboxylesterase
LALALPSPLAGAPAAERLSDPRDGLVGWYRHEGRDARLTYRPGGGLLRLAVEAGLDGEELLPAGARDCFEGAGGLRVCFERDARRRARAFRWRDGEGRSGRSVRLRDEPYRQHQVAFRSGGARLVATVLVPSGARAVPGVALIQGAGTSSRANVWSWTFADGLARRGLATLLPDKRGSGESEGDWLAADFDVLAADAAAALRALRAQAGVDADRVGVLGLSQGGWVAPLAARRAQAATCAGLVFSATTPGEQLRHELRRDSLAAGLDPAGLAALDRALELLLEHARTGEGWAAYRLAAAAAVAAAPRHAAFVSGWLPADPGAPAIGFWRGIVDFDPVDAWRRVDAPRLVVLGAEDESDNTPVGESLRRWGALYEAGPSIDLELRVQPRAGHVLEDDTTGWVSEQVLEDLAGWLRRSSRR